MTHPPLIFLVSLPRAGSTMLQKHLASHPDIHTTQEPWLMLHPLYALKTKGIETEYSFELSRQGLEAFIADLPGGRQDYYEAVRNYAGTLYQKALEKAGKNIFLDKTPRYYRILQDLAGVFPEAKIVILLRNPMAVLSSALKSWFNNDFEFLQKTPNWLDHIEGPGMIIQALQKLEGRAIVLQYENLVQNLEEGLQDLCQKLEIPYSPEMAVIKKHEGEKWKLGDPATVYQHDKAVSDYTDTWIQNLTQPHMVEFSRNYLNSLGPGVFRRMGYSFEEAHELLAAGAPTGPVPDSPPVLGQTEGHSYSDEQLLQEFASGIMTFVDQNKLSDAIAYFDKNEARMPKIDEYYKIAQLIQKLRGIKGATP